MENFMQFHGIPWDSTEFHGIFYEISWRKFHEKKRQMFMKNFIKFHRFPWNFPWNFMKLSLMKFHGIPWKNFIEFHGNS
jgi:hypothetical protein